jgi:hypothetical protein
MLGTESDDPSQITNQSELMPLKLPLVELQYLLCVLANPGPCILVWCTCFHSCADCTGCHTTNKLTTIIKNLDRPALPTYLSSYLEARETPGPPHHSTRGPDGAASPQCHNPKPRRGTLETMSAPRCRSVSSSSASATVASLSCVSSSLVPVGHIVVCGNGSGWVWYREQCSHRCMNAVAAKLCGLLLRFLLWLLRFTRACWLLLRFLLWLSRLKHPTKAVHTCIHAIKPMLRDMIRINALAATQDLIVRPFLQSRW